MPGVSHFSALNTQSLSRVVLDCFSLFFGIIISTPHLNLNSMNEAINYFESFLTEGTKIQSFSMQEIDTRQQLASLQCMLNQCEATYQI